MSPSYQLHNGDALNILKTFKDNFIDCCVTSPPYYNLRDYQHADQIGNEKTPEEYIEKLTLIFRETKRVLKDSGTCWIVINDSYSKKNLIGIPWMLASSLKADGWYWRGNIIWYKKVCLTQSVKDRPSVVHEYILFFSKQKRYYYDYTAILEPYSPATLKQLNTVYEGEAKKNYTLTKAQNPSDTKRRIIEGMAKRKGRNKSSVWEVNRGTSKSHHTAVFPEKLILPCILAGCPRGGIVLDQFVGSGTTVIAALKNDRKAIGIDTNPDYLEEVVNKCKELK